MLIYIKSGIANNTKQVEMSSMKSLKPSEVALEASSSIPSVRLSLENFKTTAEQNLSVVST